MKTHHATVEEATESDNNTHVWITCDPTDQFTNPVDYSKNWDGVDCKNCLRFKPATPAASAPSTRCQHPAKKFCQICGERFCPNDGCDPNHLEGCREANRP